MITRHISTILLIALMLSSCAKPKDGANGVSITGPTGASGAQGPAGATGLSGAAGTPGVNGTDATPVTMIKFCANATTVYPSSFPEYGFCIGGHLYATYWDGHNAWTAEVVPGHYVSTSTNAACSFTVLTNCAVQP